MDAYESGTKIEIIESALVSGFEEIYCKFIGSLFETSIEIKVSVRLSITFSVKTDCEIVLFSLGFSSSPKKLMMALN